LTESQSRPWPSAAASSTLQICQEASGGEQPTAPRAHEERRHQQGADHAEGRLVARRSASRTTSSQLCRMSAAHLIEPRRQPAASFKRRADQDRGGGDDRQPDVAPATSSRLPKSSCSTFEPMIDVARQDHPAGQAPRRGRGPSGCRTRYPAPANPQTDAVKATAPERPRAAPRNPDPVSEPRPGKVAVPTACEKKARPRRTIQCRGHRRRPEDEEPRPAPLDKGELERLEHLPDLSGRSPGRLRYRCLSSTYRRCPSSASQSSCWRTRQLGALVHARNA